MSYLERLFKLDGKVAAVTGATGQLGKMICRAFQRVGTRVVGLDVNMGGDMIDGVDYHQLDITDRQQIREVFTNIMQEHERLDILVNNAGVSTFEPFEERPEEVYQKPGIFFRQDGLRNKRVAILFHRKPALERS